MRLLLVAKASTLLHLIGTISTSKAFPTLASPSSSPFRISTRSISRYSLNMSSSLSRSNSKSAATTAAATTTCTTTTKTNKSAKQKRSLPKEDEEKLQEQEQDVELESSQSQSTPKSSTTALKKTKSAEQNDIPHVRDVITHRTIPAGTSALKIMSWNVNGLRALVANKKNTLDQLIANHKPDILCLQETKLQEENVEQYRDLIAGYTSYWSCSTVKKGYAGTAIFVSNKILQGPKSTSDEPKTNQKSKAQSKMSDFFRKPAIESVSTVSTSDELKLEAVYYDFENMSKQFEGEGRTITIETDKFFLVACYVPNSGEKLVRLKERVEEWDPFVRKYLDFLARQKPVIYTGDMNVGHLDLDIHNPDAKHIDKQAGLTPAERKSFTAMLEDGQWIDAFRYWHPEAKGQFTYWSQRTFGRPVNKGLRLDYFICSSNLMLTEGTAASGSCSALDSYILHEDTVGCSDHCPIVLVLAR